MRNKKEIQRSESNARIINAALVEFAKNGYQIATLTDVAVRAEVSKGLVTQRFGSKEGLFLDLIKFICENQIANISAVTKAPTTFEDAMISIVQVSKYLATEKPFVARFGYQFFTALEIVPESSRAYVEEYVNGLACMPFFEEYAKAGKLNKVLTPYTAFCLVMSNALSLSISTTVAKVEYIPDKDYLFVLPLISEK